MNVKLNSAYNYLVTFKINLKFRFEPWIAFAILLSFLHLSCSPKPEVSSTDLNSLSITSSSGDSQFASINSSFTQPITIKLSGISQLEGVPINFRLADGSAPATLSQIVVKTDANGEASINVSSLDSSGTISIIAQIPSAQKIIETTFNLFVNGSATKWKLSVVEGSSIVAGNTYNLKVEALLSTNNADIDFNGAKDLFFSSTAINAPDGTVFTLPADGSYTFTSGVINTNIPFSLVNSSDTGAEIYTISVTGSSLNLGNTSNLTVTDAIPNEMRIVDTNACTASEIAAPTYIVAIPETLYAFYYDSFGNCIEGIAATPDWTKSFSDVEATFTGSVTNTQSIQFDPLFSGVNGTITANDGTFADTTGSIAIDDGSATHFIITGLNSFGNFATNAGDTMNVLMEARDVAGNTAQTYTGAHTLNWTTTATDLVPPTALALGTQTLTVPANGVYNFTDGVLISPVPQFNFKNSAQAPTITVYDGGSCGASVCATSGAITISSLTSTHALVRTASGGLGGDAATFDAAGVSPTADDSYTLYCASYDSLGNYLNDPSTADWLISGVITGGDIPSGQTDVNPLVYNARATSTGVITCDLDGSVDGVGVADNSGTFTIVPGIPNYFTFDGGSGEGNAFSVSAGSNFSVTVRTYDSDNNLTTNFTNASYPANLAYLGSTAVFPTFPAEFSPANTSPTIDGTNTTSKTVNLNISGGVASVTNNKLINDTENSDEPTMQVVDPSGSITSTTSAAITVNQNSLAHMTLRTANNNGGTVINAPTLTADSSLTMYAAGYDDSGNYIGDQLADWTSTGPIGNCAPGEVAGNPAPLTGTVSAIFSPTQVGNCTLTAELGGVSDTTNSVTLSNGTINSFLVEIIDGSTTVTAGTPFHVKITAQDADGNRVNNYSPDTSFSLTTTAGNSPEGASPNGLTLLPAHFALGQAIVINVSIFDASGTFTMTATETGSGSATGTSVAITVNPNTLHHYAVTATGGSFVADKSTGFTVDVESRDEWGNATTTGIGSLIDLSIAQVSDEALVSTVANSTNLDLAGAATRSFSGMTYGVSHQIEFTATDGSGITTPPGLKQTATFTADSASIQDYTLTNFSTITPSAGDAFTAQIVARDEVGNTITGLDATLSGYTFTTTSTAATTDYANAPSHHVGTVAFTNGVSSNINFTFYQSETVLGSNITFNDGNAKTGDAGTNNITVSTDPLNNYSIETSTGLPVPADASTTFEANIKARDQYGNNVTGDASINLGVNQLVGGAAGTLGGTTTSINMSSGQQILSNLTYNVPGTMEITVTGGSVSAPALRSVDYNFSATAATLDHYQLAFTGPATAGSSFNVTVTAKDSANNTIISIDGDLDGYTYAWLGVNAAPDLTTATLPSTLSFTSGVATASLTFVEATTIASGSLILNNGVGKSGASTANLTVNPAIVVAYDLALQEASKTVGVSTTALLTAKDTYDNVVNHIDATLDTYNFAFTTNANVDAPDSSVDASTTDPVDGALSFTSGVATLTYTFYNATNDVQIGDLVINDTTNTIAIANSNSMLIGPAPGNYFTVTSNSFPATADKTAQTSTDLTITLFDDYGNTTTDASITNINLSVNRISGYTNTGNLKASLTDTGAQLDVSLIKPDFNLSAIQTIYDVAYDVAHTVEIIATKAGVTTAGSDSDDLVFNISTATVDHYDLAFDNASVVAGIAAPATLSAYDAANNLIDSHDATLDTINFTFASSANLDAPNSTQDASNADPADGSLTFSSGQASLNYTVYNDANEIQLGNLTATDTTNSIAISNSNTMTVDPAAANYITISGASTGTADSATTYSATVASNDAFGNPVATGNALDASLTLDPIRISGATNIGPLGGTITGINLRDNATQLISDLTYQVPHTIRFGFTSAASISVDNALSAAVTWLMSTATVNQYTFEPDVGTATAGVPMSFTLSAFDGGNNVIAGEDPILNTINYTFTTTANVDAPDSSEDASTHDPADGTLSFSAGTVSLNYTFFHDANDVAASDVRIDDTTNTLNSLNTNTVTVSANVADYFTVDSTSGFPADADDTIQTSTSLVITLKDDYGNPQTAASATTTNLSFNRVSGLTNTGNLEVAAIDGGGTADLTGVTLDFNAASTRILYDFKYNVGHVVEVIADDGASLTTTSSDSADLTFNTTTATVDNYILTLDNASATAGATTTASLTARDAVNNVITGSDAILDTINFTFAVTSNVDAPDTSVDASANDPANGTLTFSSGVASLNYNFYHATNNVALSDLTVTDTTNTIVTNNTDTMTINPATADHFQITASGFPVDADSAVKGSTSVTTTLYDDFGNTTTVGGLNAVGLTLNRVSGYTNTGTMNASLTDSGAQNDLTSYSLDFTSASSYTVYDIAYDVGHVVEIIASQGGITTIGADSADISFNTTTGTVNNYLLTLDSASATAGATTTASLTARDAANNVITGSDATLDTINYTFDVTANVDAPDTSVDASDNDPTNGTLTFSSGVASLNYIFYHSTNNVALSDLTVTDTTNTIVTNNSDTMSINAATADHFEITTSGFPVDADATAKTSTSITSTLYDDFGNTTTVGGLSAVGLAINRISGYTSIGTMNGALTDGGAQNDITSYSLDYTAASSYTIYDIAYDVAHVVEIIASQGGITTIGADSADITFNMSTGTVNNYLLTLDSASATAGATTTASLTARDAANNVITGNDATLDTINFTFAVTANIDAPDTSVDASDNDPTNGTLTFTSGVASLNYKFYHAANNVALSDLTVTDTTNSIVTNNSDTMIINPAVADHFTVNTAAGFPANADNSAQTSTSLVITLNDDFGNPQTAASAATTNLTFNRISGLTNTGTLEVATTDGGGTADITGVTLDFNAASTRTLYDFKYDVGHVIEIIADDAGSLTTSTANSTDLTFNTTTGTVDNYLLTLDNASATAGVTTTASLTARDAANNVITGSDATLDTINYTFAVTANVDAPDASVDASDNDPTNGTLTFSSGVASLNYTFYHDTNNVALSDLTVTDTTNSIVTNNSDTMTINAATADHFQITNSGFPEDADSAVKSATSITTTLYDDFGNTTTVGGLSAVGLALNRISGYTNTGTMNGALTDGGAQNDITSYSLDFTSASSYTIYDIAYDVAHVVEVIATEGGITTIGADSADITYNISAGSVDNYLLTLDSGSATAGATTTASLTARDAANNVIVGGDAVLDTISFTFAVTANVDAPDASVDASDNDPTNGTLTFSSGVASLNYTFYHAPNNVALSDLTVTDTTNTIVTNNTDTMTINAATADHFQVTASGFPVDADGAVKGSTSITATLYDDFGNTTTVGGLSAVGLAVNRISGYTNTGTMNGALTDGGAQNDITSYSLDFTSASSHTVYDVAYDVGHVVEIIASEGGTTTIGADSADITFNMSTGTVDNYLLTLDSASATAGATTTASLTARDGANNVITGSDATLDTINFTFAVTANVDAPDGSVDASDNDPTNGTLTFTSGVASLDYKFYHAANNVALSDLTVTDTTNTIVTNNSDTMTINAAVADYFTVDTPAGFPASADNTAQTSTSLVITLKDDFGNPQTAASAATTNLTFNRISGFTNTGTLEVATSDGGGTADITGVTLDFNAASTRTLYDFKYDVGHVIEVIADDAGSLTTSTGNSTDLTFNTVAGSVDNYLLTLDSASATAGATTTASLTARDAANNTITGFDATLDTFNFTFAVTANVDAPDTSVDASDNDPTNGTLTFTSGVASLNYKFYHAANNVALSDLTVTDTTNTIVTNNSDTMTINAAVADHFIVDSAAGFPASADNSAQTSTSLVITLKDDFGNPQTAASATTTNLAFNRISGFTNTGTLEVATTDGGGTTDITAVTLDFNAASTRTLYDFKYNVGHVIEVIADDAGTLTTATGNSTDLTFNTVAGSVDNYLLTLDSASATAGATTTASLTARDAANNTITGFDATLDTFNFTFAVTANVDAPDASVDASDNDPVNGTLTFSSGVASLNYTFYHAPNNVALSDLTVTDTTNTIVTNNTDTMTINAATADHFQVTASGFPVDADAAVKGSTSITATLYDDFGNTTTVGGLSAVGLAVNRISGYTNTGTMNGALTDGGAQNDMTSYSLDFTSASSHTVYDIAYDVAHVVEIIATQGGITTIGADSADITFNMSTGSVDNYLLTLDSAAATAGATTTASLTARDAGNNVITGSDATLDTINFTFAVTANVDAPDASVDASDNDPTNGTLTFTSGVASLNYKFYHAANNVALSDLTVTDTTNTIVTNNSDTMTINAAVADYFTVDTPAGFPASADNSAQTSTSLVITLKDDFGNPQTAASAATTNLTFNRISGFTNTGTLEVATSDGGGTADITGVTLDFNAASTRTLYDFKYDVGHVIEVIADDAGSLTTSTGNSTDLTFNTVAGSVDNYLLTLDSASATAGATTTASLTARDAANNTITGFDATLDTFNFTFAVTANVDAPDGSVDASDNDPTNGTLTFSSGVASLDYKFYHAANNVALSDLTVTDTTNTIVTNNSDTMTINAAVADHFIVDTAAGFPASADNSAQTSTSLVITLKDDFGNPQTAASAATTNLTFNRISGFTNTGTLEVATTDGGGTADITGVTLDFNAASTRTLYDFKYNVGHVIEVIADDAGSLTTSTGNSTDLTFNTVAGSVDNYLLTLDSASATAGATTTASLTARDAANNTITGFDATLDTFNFTFAVTANVDAPDTSVDASDNDPTNGTLTFSSGVASLNYKFYHATNNVALSDLTVTDTSNTIATNNSDTMTINAATADHFQVTAAGFPVDADAAVKGSTSITATLYDDFGNATTVGGLSAVGLAVNRISGYTNTGTMNGALTDGGAQNDMTSYSLDFTSASSYTIYDVAYDVAHVVEIIATQGGTTTIGADSADITFNMSTGSVDNYLLTLDSASATAGATTTASLTARDGANNVITGSDATLDTINFTFAVTANVDAPDASVDASDNDPTNGTLTFTSGVASLNYKFYHAANNVALSDLTVTDTTNTIVTNNSDTMTINAAVADHFIVDTAAGFPASADNSAQTSTSLVITLKDDFGNPQTAASAATTNLTFNRISGFTNTGTLEVATSDGGGTADITGVTLDFNAASTRTLYDFKYNVGHVIEVIADDGGSLTTSTGNSTDLTFNTVAGSVDNYLLTLDSASATAGATTTASLTARDAANNTITGFDATLDTFNFTFAVTANVDAPDASVDASDNDPANGTLTFSSGVASLNYKFYHASSNVALSDLTVTDTTNSIATNNSDTMTINAAVADYFTVDTAAGFPASADNSAQTSTSLVITLKDDFGNPQTAASAATTNLTFNRISGLTNTGTLEVATTDGGGTADITGVTLDFNAASTRTLYDFKYDVGHVIEVIADDAGSLTTSTGNSTDLTFNTVAGSVDNYLLTLDSASATAGATTTASLTARDAANNTITGFDATLDTFNFTFAVTANVDAPDTSVDASDNHPTNGTLTFSSGVASLNYKFYHATNNVALSDLTVTDTSNTIATNNSDTMTINAATADHFQVIASGFPVNADSAVKGSTSITATLYDDFGNTTTVGGLSAVGLAVNRISGYTNTGTMNGALTDGGAQNDMTSYSLDFTSASSHTIYDIAYDVGHVTEVIASQGGITTATGDATDISFNFSGSTVDHYTLTLDNASGTAGAAENATFTAYDAANNVINDQDATLNTFNFTFAINTNPDAPDASEDASTYLPAAGTLTFSSGVETLSYTFFNAANNVSASDITITDTTNSIATNNSDTMTIDHAAADHLQLVAGNSQTATANASVSTDPEVKVVDDYGNPVDLYTVNFAVTDALSPAASVTASDSSDASGNAQATWTMAQESGANTMRASATGLTGTPTFIDFSATGDPAAASKLIYTTEPVSNETVGKTFATQPVVEIRDTYDNVVASDNSTVVTLTAFDGVGCSAGAAGALANNTATASGGIATFSTLNHSAAETISVRASSGGLATDCSATTDVAASLTIDNATAVNLNTGDIHTYEVSGGVGAISFSITANNSGGNFGAPYTGGGCAVGKTCADFTAGKTGGAIVDTIEVMDAAHVANTDSDTSTIDGAVFANTGDPVDYGSNAGDLSQTFTIDNTGNATSGAIGTTFTPDNGSYWTLTSDLCNTVDLDTVSTCNISVTFKGTVAPGSGSYTATLEVTGADGGTITLNLTATTP